MDNKAWIAKIENDKKRAENNPDKPIKICAGLYYMFHNGEHYTIEHVTKNDGFSRSEWCFGTDRDPLADQHFTMWECVKGILSL